MYPVMMPSGASNMGSVVCWSSGIFAAMVAVLVMMMVIRGVGA